MLNAVRLRDGVIEFSLTELSVWYVSSYTSGQDAAKDILSTTNLRPAWLGPGLLMQLT
jgi:hypothetical protein